MHYAVAATTVAARALQGVELVCFIENLLALAAFYVSFGPDNLRCWMYSLCRWVCHRDEIPFYQLDKAGLIDDARAST